MFVCPALSFFLSVVTYFIWGAGGKSHFLYFMKSLQDLQSSGTWTRWGQPGGIKTPENVTLERPNTRMQTVGAQSLLHAEETPPYIFPISLCGFFEVCSWCSLIVKLFLDIGELPIQQPFNKLSLLKLAHLFSILGTNSLIHFLNLFPRPLYPENRIASCSFILSLCSFMKTQN